MTTNVSIDFNQRSVAGAALQDALFMNQPIWMPEFSTLNRKFGILQNETLTQEERPFVAYMAIGNGGHDTGVVKGKKTLIPLKHEVTDMGLFDQLPFVLRLPTDDLTPTERAKYRFRKVVVIEGVTYIAYYLKVLSTPNSTVQVQVRDPINGTTLFVPNSSNLSPTPTLLSNEGVNQANQIYMGISSAVTVSMDANDIAEFLNVCNILYGSVYPAIISEMAICSGVDRPATAESNGQQINYAEALGVQCCTFLAMGFLAYMSNTGFQFDMSYGSIDPLLAL